MAVIGLDLGGTKLAGALFDANGAVIAEDTTMIERRGGGEVGTLVIAALHRLMARAPDVAAIGVSVPGIAHAKSGRVWAPNIAGWDDYPLRDELRASLSYEDLPVVIEADRSCCIMGEVWHGAARGSRNAIYVTVGTGIGAGILVDGRILHGAHDIAGAIGWMALDRPWDEKYRPCGCLEHYASGDGIARYAHELLAARPGYRGELRAVPPNALRAPEVFRLYDAGDEIAMAVLHRAIELWGMATANLVSLFNPERIIFGGGVFGPAARFLPDIAREARRWAQPISIGQVELAASSLGGTAALHGAAHFALRAVSPMP
ncbi:MAG: ROK family protein [Gemmatimonadaceae bacterium]